MRNTWVPSAGDPLIPDSSIRSPAHTTHHANPNAHGCLPSEAQCDGTSSQVKILDCLCKVKKPDSLYKELVFK